MSARGLPSTPFVERAAGCACGYESDGRPVGERCPGCGSERRSTAPEWASAGYLDRLRRMSRVASVSCLAALAMWTLLLFERGIELLPWAMLCLGPLVLIVQSVAMDRIAVRELGARRMSSLRGLVGTRIVGAVLATPIAYKVLTEPEFFGLPFIWMIAPPLVMLAALLLFGSDALWMIKLDSLAKELGPPQRGWATRVYGLAMPAFAASVMFTAVASGAAFFWSIGPTLWLAGLVVGFERLRDVANEARRRSAE